MNSNDKENVQVQVEDKQQSPSVTIQDRLVGVPLSTVLNVKVVLDTVTSRGAFKAQEMSSVGTIYDTLVSILKNVTQESQNTEKEEGKSESENSS